MSNHIEYPQAQEDACMAKTKTSAAVKNRYAAKAYDRIAVVVPKGRKATVEAFAKSQGETVNGLINNLLQRETGLSSEEWKAKPDDKEEG